MAIHWHYSMHALRRDTEYRITMSSDCEPRFHIVLFQPEIPQNTGNIGRTCVAIGAKLWIVRPTGFRLDSTQLKRAGLDYWEHLNWEIVDDWTRCSKESTSRVVGFLPSLQRDGTRKSHFSPAMFWSLVARHAGSPKAFGNKMPIERFPFPCPDRCEV